MKKQVVRFAPKTLRAAAAALGKKGGHAKWRKLGKDERSKRMAQVVAVRWERAKFCVTHHHACDCRETLFRRLLEDLLLWAQNSPESSAESAQRSRAVANAQAFLDGKDAADA